MIKKLFIKDKWTILMLIGGLMLVPSIVNHFIHNDFLIEHFNLWLFGYYICWLIQRKFMLSNDRMIRTLFDDRKVDMDVMLDMLATIKTQQELIDDLKQKIDKI